MSICFLNEVFKPLSKGAICMFQVKVLYIPLINQNPLAPKFADVLKKVKVIIIYSKSDDEKTEGFPRICGDRSITTKWRSS